MTSQQLQALLRKQPFEPLKIYTTDKKVYEVRHPDQAFVATSWVMLPSKNSPDVPESVDYLSLVHIVRVEQQNAPATNGVANKTPE